MSCQSSNSLSDRKLLSAENNSLLYASFRGFTKYIRADYLKWKPENIIIPDGVHANVSGSEYTLLRIYLYFECLVDYFVLF